MNLQNWKDQAQAHWKEHQPERCRELKAAGKLDSALQYAVDQTYAEVSQLEDSGFQPDEAFQMVRERYLFPPEKQPTETPQGETTSHRMMKAAQAGQRSMPIGR